MRRPHDLFITTLQRAQLIALLALLACGAGDEGAHGPVRPNVLLVILDDVGTDLVGSYGRPGSVALPVLDGLAHEGVSFDAAWSQPVCSPARASILTGLHPAQHGIGVISGTSAGLATDSFTTLPREARKLGYATFAVGKWHLADALPGQPTPDLSHPNDAGFEHFAGSIRNLGEDGYDYWHWQKVVDGSATEVDGVYLTRDTVDEAIARIHETDGPWFGWVALHAIHVPHHLPPADLTYSGAPAAAPGLAEVARLMLEAADLQLGRLLAAIPSEERARTTVVVTSDNGSASQVMRPRPASNRGKGTLYEGGIRVPLIVQGFGVDPGAGGLRSSALVQGPDLFALLVHLMGGSTPASDSSRSFHACLSQPEDCTHRDRVYAETFAPNNPREWGVRWHEQALRDARFKLILSSRAEAQFFDLEADPGEAANLLGGELTAEQEASYRALHAEAAARALPRLRRRGGRKR